MFDGAIGLWSGLVTLFKDNPAPAAVVTLLSVGLTIWNNQKNRAATIFGHSMQAVTHLDQRWESEDLKLYRCRSAVYLLKLTQCQEEERKDIKANFKEDDALTAILNFLETVGSFVRTGAIGERTAWNLFGSAVQIYFEAARGKVEAYAKEHDTVYSEIKYFYRIARVEEERADLPCAWIWKRFAAWRLTKRSETSACCGWTHYVYALAMGRVWHSRKIPYLFQASTVSEYLERLIRLADTPSQAVPSPAAESGGPSPIA